MQAVSVFPLSYKFCLVTHYGHVSIEKMLCFSLTHPDANCINSNGLASDFQLEEIKVK